MMNIKLPILLLAAIAALAPLSVDMYLPAIPGIADYLNTTINTVQYSMSTFLLGFGGGMLLYGPLSDRFGRRPLALFGLAGFTVASLLISLSPSSTSFLVFRLLQGLLGSAATVVVPAIIRDSYGKNTAKGMSSMSMIMLIAPLVAPLGGSLILKFAEWQSIFLFLSSYGFLLFVLTWKLLPETRPQDDASTPRSFFGNYKIILANKRVYFDMFSSLLAALAFFAYLTSVSFIYITYFGASETLFGLLFACSAFSLIIVNFINMRLVIKLGPRRMMVTGMITGTVSSVLLLIAVAIDAELYWIAACFFLVTGGLGLSWTNADSLVLIEFPQQASSASAVMGTLRFGIGSFAGPILAVFYTGTPLPAALLIACCIGGGLLIQIARYICIKD